MKEFFFYSILLLYRINALDLLSCVCLRIVIEYHLYKFWETRHYPPPDPAPLPRLLTPGLNQRSKLGDSKITG